MTREALVGFVGKRVTVAWDSAAPIGKSGGGERGSLTGTVVSVGDATVVFRSLALPLEWITSVQLAPARGQGEVEG